MHSCFEECSNNSKPSSCKFNHTDLAGSAIDPHNACAVDETTLQTAGICPDHGSYEFLNMNTCESGSIVAGTDYDYSDADLGVTFRNNLVDSEVGIVETIKRRLQEVHGDNFFLISFINPVKASDKAKCSTEELDKYEGFSESERYQNIVDALGPGRALAVRAETKLFH